MLACDRGTPPYLTSAKLTVLVVQHDVKGGVPGCCLTASRRWRRHQGVVGRVICSELGGSRGGIRWGAYAGLWWERTPTTPPISREVGHASSGHGIPFVSVFEQYAGHEEWWRRPRRERTGDRWADYCRKQAFSASAPLPLLSRHPLQLFKSHHHRQSLPARPSLANYCYCRLPD